MHHLGAWNTRRPWCIEQPSKSASDKWRPPHGPLTAHYKISLPPQNIPSLRFNDSCHLLTWIMGLVGCISLKPSLCRTMPWLHDVITSGNLWLTLPLTPHYIWITAHAQIATLTTLMSQTCISSSMQITANKPGLRNWVTAHSIHSNAHFHKLYFRTICMRFSHMSPDMQINKLHYCQRALNQRHKTVWLFSHRTGL